MANRNNMTGRETRMLEIGVTPGWK